MAYINDLAFDAGIAYLITNGNRLHVCSQEPTSVGTLYSLGNKASITMGTAGDGTPSGRNHHGNRRRWHSFWQENHRTSRH